MQKLITRQRETVRLSGKHIYVDALRVKVMRTLISPQLVQTSYNVAVPLCCIL
jgi:hypothetical protein